MKKDRVEAGSHWSALEPPDLILLYLEGDVALNHAVIISAATKEYGRGMRHLVMLINLGDGANLCSEVRKLLAAALQDLPLRGTAIYGADMHSMVVAKLLLLYANRGRADNPISLHATERDARDWIQSRRLEVCMTGLDRRILQEIARQKGSVQMGPLARQLGESASTLRRRLRYLVGWGLVHRTGDKSAARYFLVQPPQSEDSA